MLPHDQKVSSIPQVHHRYVWGRVSRLYLYETSLLLFSLSNSEYYYILTCTAFKLMKNGRKLVSLKNTSSCRRWIIEMERQHERLLVVCSSTMWKHFSWRRHVHPGEDGLLSENKTRQQWTLLTKHINGQKTRILFPHSQCTHNTRVSIKEGQLDEISTLPTNRSSVTIGSHSDFFPLSRVRPLVWLITIVHHRSLLLPCRQWPSAMVLRFSSILPEMSWLVISSHLFGHFLFWCSSSLHSRSSDRSTAPNARLQPWWSANRWTISSTIPLISSLASCTGQIPLRHDLGRYSPLMERSLALTFIILDRFLLLLLQGHVNVINLETSMTTHDRLWPRKVFK